MTRSTGEGDAKEYRLSWEYATAFSGDWYPTERVAPGDSDILDQYETLKRWAESGEEQIRNVKLEARKPNDWVEVSRVVV